MEVRGGAHRFEAVRAGLGVVEKTAWYDMMMPPSEVTAPDRRFTRLREEPLQIESRDEDATDKAVAFQVKGALSRPQAPALWLLAQCACLVGVVG